MINHPARVQKGTKMELNKWVGGCKVHASPWIDKKNIYVNVQYFKPGQSIYQPPVWEKRALIANDEAGRRLVFEYTDTLVNAFRQGKIPDKAFVQVGKGFCSNVGQADAIKKEGRA